MDNYEILPTTENDFKAMMAFLVSFLRIPDTEFEAYLWPLIVTKAFHRPGVFQKAGRRADKACYVAEGMVFAFYYNLDNEVVPFRIFNAGEIAVIPESFMTGKIAKYGLMACGATRILEISLESMQGVYADFPQAVMLALMIVATLFEKDLKRNQLLELRSHQTIEQFYTQHSDLYGNTSYLFRDKLIAKYLHLSPITFSRMRKKVFPDYPS